MEVRNEGRSVSKIRLDEKRLSFDIKGDGLEVTVWLFEGINRDRARALAERIKRLMEESDEQEVR